jgi:hypothetical protein
MPGSVSSMCLEDVLRDVQPDRSNLLHGRLLQWQLDTVTLARRCRRGAAAHGGLLLAQRHPDGDGFEMFRPLDNTNSTAALIDALRLYLVSGATK